MFIISHNFLLSDCHHSVQSVACNKYEKAVMFWPQNFAKEHVNVTEVETQPLTDSSKQKIQAAVFYCKYPCEYLHLTKQERRDHVFKLHVITFSRSVE